MKEIRIATRASRLALVQSEYIKSLLEELDADVQVTLVRISTRGDRDKSDFLYKSESMGFFTSEVENALIDGRADLAVGSRYLGGMKYRFSVDRFVGSRLLAGLVRLVTRTKITDPTSGFRAVNRRGIRFFSLHYPQAYLGDTVESLVLLVRQGMTAEEVPAKMAQRKHGTSSVGFIVGLVHTLRITLAVLIDCLEKKLEELPPEEGTEP